MKGEIVSFPKEQSDLLKAAALIIKLENGDKYYHLPQFYKQIDETTFECLTRKELPDEVERIINPCNL